MRLSYTEKFYTQNFYFHGLLVGLFIIQASCSAKSFYSLYNGNDITYESSDDPRKPPLSFELRQAYLENNLLNLKTILNTQSDLIADNVIVGLIGLHEGSVKEEQYVRLSDFTKDNELPFGSRILIPFQFDVTGLTEFQLIAAWGEEGSMLLNEKIEQDSLLDIDKSNRVEKLKIDPESEDYFNTDTVQLYPPEPVKPSFKLQQTEFDSLKSENKIKLSKKLLDDKNLKGELSLTDIQIIEEQLPCDSAICAIRIRMKGVVANFSPDSYSDVVLAFGLFWVKDGTVPKVPSKISNELAPGEEELNFRKKVFKPGERVSFEIDIGRPVYSVPGGRFIPQVRFLNYGTIVSAD
ncbi:MAG TPA: hypothetical protein PKA63_08480 [Oligoflexia bacterium]|nr:hypothetical protein [Oligoflexia bacterium]HMP48686.1 hypothetical protein [Oligoflexia bacterium]